MARCKELNRSRIGLGWVRARSYCEDLNRTLNATGAAERYLWASFEFMVRVRVRVRVWGMGSCAVGLPMTMTKSGICLADTTVVRILS